MSEQDKKIKHLRGAMERATDALRTDNLVKVFIYNPKNYDHVAKYIGRAWLSSDPVYGHSLSDMSDREYDRKCYSDPDEPVRRARVGMKNLFPKALHGKRIEYEITVRARMIPDPKG